MEQIVVGVASAPAVLALVNIFKPFIPDSRFYPLLALVLGIVWNVAAAFVLGQPLPPAAFLGAMAGFIAGGVWDVTQSRTPPPALNLDDHPHMLVNPGSVILPVVPPGPRVVS